MPFHIWYQYKNFADTVYKLLQKSRVPTLRFFFFFFSPMWSTGPWNFDFITIVHCRAHLNMCSWNCKLQNLIAISRPHPYLFIYIYSLITTDIDQRSQNLRHLLSRHGVPIGGIRIFSAIRITVIDQVGMYCGLSVKINTCETPHGAWRSWTGFVFISACVVGKNPNTPNWGHGHGWRRHYTEQYMSSEISFQYLQGNFGSC